MLLGMTSLHSTAVLAQSVPSPVGGFTSDGVRWVTTVPIYGRGTWTPPAGMGWTNSGSGRVANGHLFIWAEGVTIYDISDPLAPRFVSYIPRPAPAWAPQGVVSGVAQIGRFDTNGEIVVIPAWDRGDRGGVSDPGSTGELRHFALYIYDVTDPANPREIGQLSRLPYPHPEKLTVGGPFCILDCTWVYDRWGAIIDLRDPSRPKLLRKRWTRGMKFNNSALGVRGATEIVEVAPGRILLGAHPMYLLDVTDPARPKVMARSDGSPNSRGDIAWPGFPRSDVVLSTNIGEGGWSRCEMAESARDTSAQSVFSTWDTDRWEKTGLISRVDDYRLSNGTYTDGDPAFSGSEGVIVPGVAKYAYSNGCSFGVFDVRPASGAIEVAVAANGHGLKFFHVGQNGTIELADWFLGHGANVINTLWANGEVVYALDANRGIDVLQVDR